MVAKKSADRREKDVMYFCLSTAQKIAQKIVQKRSNCLLDTYLGIQKPCAKQIATYIALEHLL
jgi:hypothetical protein